MATVVLAGGGTGGHVYPAIAIGDELRARGHNVLYYGDPDRLEARVAPECGYVFRPVQARAYPRSGWWGRLRFVWSLFRATLASRRNLKRDDADLVLGVGGYISAGPALAAWTLGKKVALHEANAVLGLANRLCARVADLVLLTFASTRERVATGGEVALVGVPIRPGLDDADRETAAKKYGLDPSLPTVLFVGGSLGAQRINELALACAGDNGFQVLHLCGARYFEDVSQKLGEPPTGATLVAYEDRMADAFAVADLVVARAGSSTLGELCALGLPSVLVPSANVTENHQEENARGLVDVGAAVMLVERDWDLDRAHEIVRERVSDREGLAQMGAAARRAAHEDAASLAADHIERLLS